MNNLWYNNPSILFNNFTEIYPFEKLNYYNKINSIARLGLYLLIVIILFDFNKILLLVPLILFIFSYYKIQKTVKKN